MSSSTTTTKQLDETVAKVLDRERAARGDSEDEDGLLAELEREDTALDGFRERRLQQLHEEFAQAQAQRANLGSGTYEDVQDEKAVMDISTYVRFVDIAIHLLVDVSWAETRIHSCISITPTLDGARSLIRIWHSWHRSIPSAGSSGLRSTRRRS